MTNFIFFEFLKQKKNKMQYSDTHESLNSPEKKSEVIINQDENESFGLYDENNIGSQTPFTRTYNLAVRVPELISDLKQCLKHRIRSHKEGYKKDKAILRVEIRELEIKALNKKKERIKIEREIEKSENSQPESEYIVLNDDEARGSSSKPCTSTRVIVPHNLKNENSKIDYSTRRHLICKHLPFDRTEFYLLFETAEICHKNCFRNHSDRPTNQKSNEKHGHYIVSMINPDQDLWQLYKDENGKRKNGWGQSEKIKNKSQHDKIVKVNKMRRSTKSSS